MSSIDEADEIAEVYFVDRKQYERDLDRDRIAARKYGLVDFSALGAV